MSRLIVALDNQHQNEAVIGEDWITVWPDDFTFIRYLSDDVEVPVFPSPIPATESTPEAPVVEEVAETALPETGNPVGNPDSGPAAGTYRPDLSETGSLYLPTRTGN